MTLNPHLSKTSKHAKRLTGAELFQDDVSKALQHGGRAFLMKLKQRSVRRNNSWFRVLSLENRRFIDLVIQAVENIRSPLLLGLLKPLTEKLLSSIGGARGLMGELAFKTQDFGRPLANKISMIAAQWGNRHAARWATNDGFARYLAVIEINSLPFFQIKAKT
jgi:hypothetical protein